MVFEYKRPEDISLEAYGRKFEIPPKTAFIVDKVNEINKRVTSAKTCAEQIEAVWDGVAVFIGDDETESIFPKDKLISVTNSDEITAFWFALNNLSNRETELVIKKYKSNPDIRVSSNPKK